MTACNSDVVEPVVPFSLGVLIANNGYGAANNLQMSSAQPEIIDNEKGLLIKFAITGTQLGNDSISPSLTVHFGDILPKTTKMARWIMTSTLSGIFSNYSATFQNTNPLGEILTHNDFFPGSVKYCALHSRVLPKATEETAVFFH